MAVVADTNPLGNGVVALKLFALYPPPCLDYRHQNAAAPEPRRAVPQPAGSRLDLLGSFRTKPDKNVGIQAHDLFLSFRELSLASDVPGVVPALPSVPVALHGKQSEEHAELSYLPSLASTSWYFSKSSEQGSFSCQSCRCDAKAIESPTLFGALLKADHLRLLRGQLPCAPIVWPQHGLCPDQIPSWTTKLQPQHNSGLCLTCKAPLASWVVLEIAELAKFFVTCSVQPTVTSTGLSQRWTPWRGMQWEGPTPSQLNSAFCAPLTLRNCVARLTRALQLARQWASSTAPTATAQDSDARILNKFLHFCAVKSTLLQLEAQLAASPPKAAEQHEHDNVSYSSSSSGYNPERHRKRTRSKERATSSRAGNKSARTSGMQPVVQYRQEPAPRRILSKMEAAAELQTLPLPVRRLMRYDWRSSEWVARARTTLGELEVNGTSAFMAALTRDYVRAVELNVQPHMLERQQKYWLVLQNDELKNMFVDIQGPTDAMDVRLKLTWKGPNPDEIGAQCERMPQHAFVSMDNWAEITRAAIAQRIQYHTMLEFPAEPQWARGLPGDAGYDGQEEDNSDAESLLSLSDPHTAALAQGIAAAAEQDTEWQQAGDGTVVAPLAAAAFLLSGLADGSDDEGGGPPEHVQPPSIAESVTATASTSDAEADDAGSDAGSLLALTLPSSSLATLPKYVRGRESPSSPSDAVSAVRDLS